MNEIKTPRISVLMPVFNQGAFLRRALESLKAQTESDWELILVNDGSTDDTGLIAAQVAARDPRIRLYTLPQNRGLGNALNQATMWATSRYLAYLPADDVLYPEHLKTLADLLDVRPDLFAAYGGVRWNYNLVSQTLCGDLPDGTEVHDLLINTRDDGVTIRRSQTPPSKNPLALVQVMHRRLDDAVRWTTRAERVSDTLERDFWHTCAKRGARFGYAKVTTAEWVDHPDQRHKIIAGPEGGLTRYRCHYGIGPDTLLCFEPSRGNVVDEAALYRPLREKTPVEPSGLHILLVGELGFNPERIAALTERGHRLSGFWVEKPQGWDTVGPLPFASVEDIRDGPGWEERVRAARPDVIYALLNCQALPLIRRVIAADLGIPVVFHFKEGPQLCAYQGLWGDFVYCLLHSDGQIFLNQESFDWCQAAVGGALDPARTLLMDGDLPKRDWMTDEWQTKLSHQDGQIHTVCAGRPLGMDPFEEIAAAKIHVHLYGRSFQELLPVWTRKALATGYLHLHPAVSPAQWVRELSQYDAGWLHNFTSNNGGDIRRATFDNLNLPARLGTYAAAGLPWILRDNQASGKVAVERLARETGVGVFFEDFAQLGERLRDQKRLTEQTERMRAERFRFAFDTYVDTLVDFFQAARRSRK